MGSDFVIRAENLGKCYQIYEKPIDRLKQSLWRGKKQFYREFWALKKVSFEIKQSETVGIIGSNGSGKSTLLQLISGILNPTQGQLAINGRIAALLELGAGFNPEFTGRENILINASIMGLTRSEINACYDEIVDFADIGNFIDQPVKTYSSGMYVRLAFATAIHVSPDILLVDEALSVGDIRFQQKCIRKIKTFCTKGTVIFVSHDTTALTELCSRTIWIESGKIQMDGQSKLVIEKYLQYMYEGDTTDKTIETEILPSVTDKADLDYFCYIRNDIRQFGNYNVAIEKVKMLSDGYNSGAVYSMKPCEINMIIKANEDINNPIIGFVIKDRLGREIIGDNTSLMKQKIPSLLKPYKYQFSFQIAQWPNLCAGDYTLSIAVANGTLEEHEQCHWLHDVITFKSIPLRKPAGIFSVADTDVKFARVNN